jgi:carbon monoxide dehydrogenase subunit G
VHLEYNGEEKIPAGLDTVWTFVIDPERVGRCFPDVVDVMVQDSTHFEVVVKVGVGPVRGKFKIKVELLPASSKRRIDVKMSGGGLGSTVDLISGADLVDAGDGTTLLKWGGQAEARGPIAAVGGRVLDAQAQKLIALGFGNVRQQLTA